MAKGGGAGGRKSKGRNESCGPFHVWGQAAHFFHTVEVNLNQVTTMVGYLPPSAAKAHAVDARPKRPKPKPNKGKE